MKISLTMFKNVLANADIDETLEFLCRMQDVYELDPEQTCDRYCRLAQAKNYPMLDIRVCAWSSRLYDGDTGYTDSEGRDVSPYSRNAYGILCGYCRKLYNMRQTQMATMYAGRERRQHRICPLCLDRYPSRVYNAVSECYYENNDVMQGLLMPTTIDFDNLKFNSAEELYMSYSSRGRDYPPVPLDRHSEEIQHTMDGSHSGDPLRHRAGFLYDEKEQLPVIPHWLGVELEVVPNPTGIKTPGFFYKVASTLNKFTIIKPDGSLPTGGFEICSVPATLKKHYELWEDFFEKASPLLHSWGSGRCGMHVHMNKAFYADSAMGKALVFVNSTENRPFIELVAGRTANNYMQLHPKKLVDYRTSQACGHYEALSISQHTGKTLELRIFRGNVKKAGFFKNLEFADALGHFVHETSMQALKSSDFLSWVSQDHIRSRYPYFIGWAVNHKLFEAKKGKNPVTYKKFPVPQTAKQEFLELA